MTYPFVGNCYVTSEAAYHLLGGREAGWIPMHMKWEGKSHWFLKNKWSGQIVDLTRKQFANRPNYSLARGKGFLTVMPSKRAQALMSKLVWSD